MAFTQTDLNNLDAAIKTNTLEVRFQDRMQRFQTAEDMLKLRALIYLELNPTSQQNGMRRQIRMFGSKGL